MQESVLTGYGVVGFMYPGRDPARGRTVAQGSPAAQASPVAHKSHGAVRLRGGSPTAQIIAQGPFSGGVVITGSGIYRGVSRPRPTYNIA